MEEKLKPALLYAFWIDAKNLTELTRPWYAKKLGIPQCFYYSHNLSIFPETLIQMSMLKYQIIKYEMGLGILDWGTQSGHTRIGPFSTL